MKSGKLKGYSMFAVNLGGKESQGNRAYKMQEAPGGRKMDADLWDITMVALVDKPAVSKATYVIMRRAPDGKPIIAPAQKETNQTKEGDTPAMRKISRVAVYHNEETAEAETKVEETAPVGETTATKEGEEQAQETPEQGDLATTVKAIFQEQMESLTEQVQGMIDASLEPLKESFRTLETKQARFSGAGALPGSSGDTGNDEDGEKGKPLSWVNYGSKPKAIQTNSHGK